MRRLLCLCLSGVLAVLTACSSAGAAYGRELEDTVLVQVVGVDVTDGMVALTAAGGGGEEERLLQTVSAAGLEEAFRALPAAGERWFSLTNVTHILVGDGVDVRQVLNYVLDDPDMSWTAAVWAVNGFAGILMEGTQDGGAGRLAVLEQRGMAGISVKDALAGLLSDGAVELPVLAVKDGVLEPAGTLEFSSFS